MDLHKDYWNEKYSDSEISRINKPSEFIKFAIEYFPQNSNILELGAGSGEDTQYLREKQFTIIATDFSDIVLKHLQEKFNKNTKVNIAPLDLTQLFPFTDNSFDVVLANLVLHYFDEKTTRQIYDEIFRVLKKGGILAVMVNTTTDTEYGQGKKLEEDFYELAPGRPKRYFSKQSLKTFTGKFETIILDDQGIDSRRSYKANLIRFIGKKPQ